MPVVYGLPTTKKQRQQVEWSSLDAYQKTTEGMKCGFISSSPEGFNLGLAVWDDKSPTAPTSIPVSRGSAYYLLPPRKSRLCSCGGNTLDESFCICHWAKLYMCPEGKWVTQIYTHSVRFLSSSLLRFIKLWNNAGGEEGRGRDD